MPDARSLYYQIAHRRYDTKAHPYWHLDPHISLGDFGYIKADGSFDHQGNIYDNFIVSQSDCPVSQPKLVIADELFTYGCQYNVKAVGDSNRIAKVEIDFYSTESLLIYAHNLKSLWIESLHNLQKRVIEVYEKGEWDRKYSIVTEVVTADSLRYYSYMGSKGKLELKAKISPEAFNIKKDFGSLNISSTASLDTTLFHERALPDEALFVYKAKRLVKPVLDIAGSPRLEAQADEQASEMLNRRPSSAEEFMLGEV